MKIEVQVAKTTQSAIPELNRPEHNLYYLVIGEGEGQLILNVGEKTYTSVNKLISANETKDTKAIKR